MTGLSGSGTPSALREELGIQVLPFPIAMGERELADGFDFTPEEFYDMLLAAPKIPTHAALNPYIFEEMFEQVAEPLELIEVWIRSVYPSAQACSNISVNT